MLVWAAHSRIVLGCAQKFRQDLLALPVAIRPRGIEKIAAQLHSAVERLQTFVVCRPRPPGKSPHSVTNFADLPSCASKAPIVHHRDLLRFGAIVAENRAEVTGTKRSARRKKFAPDRSNSRQSYRS